MILSQPSEGVRGRSGKDFILGDGDVQRVGCGIWRECAGAREDVDTLNLLKVLRKSATEAEFAAVTGERKDGGSIGNIEDTLQGEQARSDGGIGIDEVERRNHQKPIEDRLDGSHRVVETGG